MAQPRCSLQSGQRCAVRTERKSARQKAVLEKHRSHGAPFASHMVSPSTACNMVARFDSCGEWKRGLSLARLRRHGSREHEGSSAQPLQRPRGGLRPKCSLRLAVAERRACRAACGVSTIVTLGFVFLYDCSFSSQSFINGEEDGSCVKRGRASVSFGSQQPEHRR